MPTPARESPLAPYTRSLTPSGLNRFGSGVSGAGSRLRRRVLAHELTHTIQQTHSNSSRPTADFR